MDFFTQTFQELPDYDRLCRAIDDGEVPVCVTGLSPIHKAQLTLTLSTRNDTPILLLTGTEADAIRLAADINGMAGAEVAAQYPAKELLFTSAESKSAEYEHERLHVLSAVQQGRIRIVTASVEAAMQPTIPPGVLKSAYITLDQNGTVDLKDLTQRLLAAGYTRCENVEGRGQFAVRGSIVDVFPVQMTSPVRMELWGDEVDTLSFFDTETQRRTDPVAHVEISPASEILYDSTALAEQIRKFSAKLRGKRADAARAKLAHDLDRLEAGLPLMNIDKYYALVYPPTYLTDYLHGVIVLSETSDIHRQAQGVTAQFREDLEILLEDGTLCKGLDGALLDYHGFQDALADRPCVYVSQFLQGGERVPFRKIISIEALQNATWGGEIRQLLEDLKEYVRDHYRIVLAVGSEKTLPILVNDLQESGIRCSIGQEDDLCPPGAVLVTARSISAGFAYPENKTALIVQTRMHAARKRKSKHKAGMEIQSLADLHPGDLVVHTMHGVGRFLGIHKLEMEGVAKDYITIQYAGTEKLYVPVTQLDLVSRYIGASDESNVKLNKLSSAAWQKNCASVRKAVHDMAEELMKLYAKREKSEGYAFYPDDELQRDFEERFPYAETDDQLQSISEIKADMQRVRPMDRLLCGDVGFGKTEVALRAAFKCVSDSMQCALLCPTTILAWQHYQTVLSRFDGYPIRVELLSRFRSPAQQKEILEKLERGEIDMIIGTHRLVQKDVKFRDLGLVIIDEEQRFGVAQKEHFKEMRKNIDILTLSATPIPRTLNMAMSGIRDMSVIEEAPLDRHPVQTYVLEHDNAVIHEAIRRELRRGGQVFYLYNNVEGIEAKAIRISEAIPEANVAVGHGKMSEQELSDVWRRMLNQEVNVLVCTTIIETGVDLPNANTLIIENADRFGLSQLHQIRGRVGRSPRRAYAYFTYNGAKVLSDISQKRLTAIREFTEFGSGFKIAMRDLELRGAGNILGAEQHGHMEDVGYDMYLKLLGDAVREEKGEQPEDIEERDCLIDVQVQAHIPESYIESLSNRLDAYRRIADIRSKEDSRDVIDELLDRYGDVPSSVMGLIDIALVRNRAAAMGVYEIRQNTDSLMLYLSDIRRKEVPELIGRLPGRAMLSAGGKPYIAVRTQKSEKPLELLKTIFS